MHETLLKKKKTYKYTNTAIAKRYEQGIMIILTALKTKKYNKRLN